MSVRYFFAMSLLLLSLPQRSFAQAEDLGADEGEGEESTIEAESPVVEEATTNVRHGLTLGYEYSYDSYNEPDVMKETGSLQGLGIGYRARVQRFLFAVSGNALIGTLNYDGGLVDRKTNKTTPYSTTSLDYSYSAKGTVGVNALPEEFSFELIPFVGIGTRYLNDELQGIGAYQREISYLYLPVGIEMRFSLPRDRKLAFVAEYDDFLTGTVKSHMTDVGYSRDLQNTQSSGVGYRLTADFSMPLSNLKSDLHVGPYYQHWHIAQSDMQELDGKAGWHEPENTTDQIGVTVAIGL